MTCDPAVRHVIIDPVVEKETMMIDLEALNSATKYPSIRTYHALGERGSLTEEVTGFHGDVVLSEKIDGSNSRIIRLPDGDWLIGSRVPKRLKSGIRRIDIPERHRSEKWP